MPTYRYWCRTCGEHSLRNVPIDRRDDQVCPTCTEVLERPVAANAPAVVIGAEHQAAPKGGAAPSHGGQIDTSQLPFVGRDGKLYSADGSTVLRE